MALDYFKIVSSNIISEQFVGVYSDSTPLYILQKIMRENNSSYMIFNAESSNMWNFESNVFSLMHN